MGKAGRWLRNFFLPGGRKGRKANDRADTDCQSVLSAPLPTPAAAAPSVREKRRWSFRRPGSAAGKADAGAGAGASGGQGPQGPLASSSSHCFSEAEVHVVVVQEQDDQRAVAEFANAAGPDASPPPPPPARGCEDEEDAAAIRIQSAFRSYLARKALCALRGMVKLQAMVRGQLVRRQADVTLRRMQALVDAQRRARAERLRLLEVDDDARHQLADANTTPWQPPSRRGSPQHPRSRKPLEAVERGAAEENVKIVEVDDAGVAQGGRRSSSFCSTTPGRTPAKAELHQKVSPTPSALTDASARTLSGRFDDASFSSAWEPAPSRRGNAAWRADHRAAASPSYMANTKSSRAKARSQSAPRPRPSSASEPAAAASPSPSCCQPRPPSRGGSGGARRRASLDPLDLPGAPGGSTGRMERCASRALALARSSVGSGAGASLPGSECGSSSTAGHRGNAQGAWHG